MKETARAGQAPSRSPGRRHRALLATKHPAVHDRASSAEAEAESRRRNISARDCRSGRNLRSLNVSRRDGRGCSARAEATRAIPEDDPAFGDRRESREREDTGSKCFHSQDPIPKEPQSMRRGGKSFVSPCANTSDERDARIRDIVPSVIQNEPLTFPAYLASSQGHRG